MISCYAVCLRGIRYGILRVRKVCAFGKICQIQEEKVVVVVFEDAVEEKRIVVVEEKIVVQLKVEVGCIGDVEEVAVVVEEDICYICQ